ncbi:uncharacterized protein [Eurosta solidaginis]|uniref:uncharacterized protein n=1 Tax=Eurosta solidaginis TaxID=178769 RepID=UPI003530E843
MSYPPSCTVWGKADTAVAYIATTAACAVSIDAAVTNTPSTAFANMNTNIASITNIDEELAALRKRVEMLQLMKEIDELRTNAILPQHRRLDFSDIEHALPKFSGVDISLTVQNFLRDFEEVTEASGANERLKLLALRRCLTGTAKIFLTFTTTLNYGALKKALEREFAVPVNRIEIHKMLEQRRWDKKKKKSLHCYVLAMQAIGKRVNITEQEIIEFIIDGISGTVSNIHTPAATCQDVRRTKGRYERRYLVADAVTTTTGRKQASWPSEENKLKCFNCPKNGHIKPNCPYPLQPEGSCFRCWRMGHDHRSCTNAAKVLKPKNQIATVMGDEYGELDTANAYNYSG